MIPQHFHTIPTSCAVLPPLTQICFVFVSVQRRVVEGSGVDSSHFDVSYILGCCNVVAILNMAEMVCLDHMQKLCSA